MTAAGDGGGAADDRRAFRAFVRRHHPDVGGDPAVFRDGLARRDSGPGTAGRAAAAPTAGDAARPVADDDPRLDAPIVAVRHVTLHRLGRLGRRLVRRYDPRPGSARVH